MFLLVMSENYNVHPGDLWRRKYVEVVSIREFEFLMIISSVNSHVYVIANIGSSTSLRWWFKSTIIEYYEKCS